MDSAKRLLAAWRILVGVWAPRNWDLSIPALTPYTIPLTPAENQWIKRTPKQLSPVISSDNIAGQDTSSLLATNLASVTSVSSNLTVPPSTPRKRPPKAPSRRLVRHVLRARAKAVTGLASFFAQLEKAGPSKMVYASPHLAERFGGGLGPISCDVVSNAGASSSGSSSVSTPGKSNGNGNGHGLGLNVNTPAEISGITIDPEIILRTPGWRYTREVVAFLRERGAKIATLDKDEMDWAALSSDGEGDSTMLSSSAGVRDDLIWVSPTH